MTVDGIPYHRLLPWVMPGRADTIAADGLKHAARLVTDVRPSVLHAASNYSNALIALALRDATQLPVLYEVRGFWEDTWLSRHSAGATSDLRHSDRYVRSRALETHCMQAADLVVTLGEAMRDEIIERGIDRGEHPHRAERSQPRVPPAAARRHRAQEPARHHSRTSTSSAWSPAWSRTRASARCSRP